MSQTLDPLRPERARSPELLTLLANCPEHLFSTDYDELAPIVIRVAPVVVPAPEPRPLAEARVADGLEKAA